MADDDFEATDRQSDPKVGTPFVAFGLCARCHRPLTRPSTIGGCLHCIVNFVGLDEDPHVTSAPSDSAEVRRYSHFEIELEADGSLAELGHGAMGTTYRAVDTVLHSPVALKVIGRNVADSPAVRSRFLREARSAARLRHPNIASVFHYGEQEGECFYVMELVAGETLEERVRRDGPLSPSVALDITVQIAHALAAAEAQGIVHRDLKPSNVMLSAFGQKDVVGTPLVKVIDFGLAKVVAPGNEASGVSDTRGGFVGTPAFASPEQFIRGEDERIDTRSDIYSLGVTLWYLLCAKLPFLGATLNEIHEQQTHGLLPWDQLRGARMPKAMISLLRSMLSAAPASRPQSTRELLAVLEKCRLVSPPSSRLLRRRRLQLLGGPLALAALVGIACIAAFRWSHRAATLAPTERTIAVLPFENLSPNPTDAFFATGVQDQITADLAKIASLRVVGSDSAKSYPAGTKRDLAAIGKELGVGHLLTGSLERREDRVHIAVSITDLHDLSRPWNRLYDLRLPEVFAVQGEITRAVAERLQASLSPEEKAIINRPPTSNLQAYDLYLRAEEHGPYVELSDSDRRQDEQRRISLLEEAVQLDPNFVLAYCQLANHHDNIFSDRAGSSVAELTVDHRGLAEKYLDTARRLQPDSGEVHLTAAHHYYYANKDYAQAQEELEAARGTMPNNARLESFAGAIARRRGHWAEAIRSYQRADELEPHDTRALMNLLFVYHAQRHYDDFDRVAAEIIARQPGHWNDVGEHSRIVFERWANLEPMRDYLIHFPPEDSPNEEEPMIVATLGGDPDEMDRALAASKLDQFMIAGVALPRAWYTALAARIRGDDTAARAAFALARPTIENEVRVDSTSSRLLSTLAIIDAGLGRKDDAIREAKRACELAPFDGAALDAPIIRCNLAIVYAWTGETDQAFAEMKKLVDLPYAGSDWPDRPSYGDFRRNSVWNPLRADPRFELLLKRLAPVP